MKIYPIGTTFTRATGNHKNLEAVVDIHRTYNNEHELIKVMYVTQQRFVDQPLIDYEVPAATIARALTISI